MFTPIWKRKAPRREINIEGSKFKELIRNTVISLMRGRWMSRVV
jgi:hypothetical protein